VAAVHVGRLGVPVFVPMAHRLVHKGRWMEPKETGPLFPRYIFFSTRMDAPWGDIAHAACVIRVLCDTEGNPLPVPSAEMRVIRKRDERKDRSAIVARYKSGQRVRIAKGAFEGLEGLYDSCAANRVKVLLSMFGRQTDVVMDESDVVAC
jgi:transcription antitermination factor NusG